MLGEAHLPPCGVGYDIVLQQILMVFVLPSLVYSLFIIQLHKTH